MKFGFGIGLFAEAGSQDRHRLVLVAGALSRSSMSARHPFTPWMKSARSRLNVSESSKKGA